MGYDSVGKIAKKKYTGNCNINVNYLHVVNFEHCNSLIKILKFETYLKLSPCQITHSVTCVPSV